MGEAAMPPLSLYRIPPLDLLFQHRQGASSLDSSWTCLGPDRVAGIEKLPPEKPACLLVGHLVLKDLVCIAAGASPLGTRLISTVAPLA